MKKMANSKHPLLQFLLLVIFLLSAAAFVQGSRSSRMAHSTSGGELQFQNSGNKDSKRLMIGSVAPTCTYNECRGCKYKCRAEQVPVEGNDPIHSAYHYKCVCHR
ncbi:OLC1v1006629C2 [Oldenlandia corymbosa var. corymbosa]|uniref:OLC1v1006629C2 n=2 Tax=Oldenlandia corymbosa var. corymbosa TaxID=529605 RepID=A0AAV1DHZ3_OLDCO|nr:OLC1v1006629C2 [Oldenlandia corymbosa var. corymbosa]